MAPGFLVFARCIQIDSPVRIIDIRMKIKSMNEHEFETIKRNNSMESASNQIGKTDTYHLRPKITGLAKTILAHLRNPDTRTRNTTHTFSMERGGRLIPSNGAVKCPVYFGPFYHSPIRKWSSRCLLGVSSENVFVVLCLGLVCSMYVEHIVSVRLFLASGGPFFGCVSLCSNRCG